MNFFPDDYGYARCAAFSPKLKVANPSYNLEEIKKCIVYAEEHACVLALFPEMSLTGYTCGDLFFSRTLQAATESALDDLLVFLKNREIVVITGMPVLSDSRLYNCAAVIQGGGEPFLAGLIAKKVHPNYSEFYDKRWFADGSDADTLFYRDTEYPQSAIFDVNGRFKFGLEICEDLWVAGSPSDELTKAGAHVILNLSASNEFVGKKGYRRDLVKIQSAKLTCAYLYASAGPHESTTDTVFSGHLIAAENGKTIAESGTLNFEGESIVSDFDIEAIENERIRFSSYKSSWSRAEIRSVRLDIQRKSTGYIARSITPFPFIPADSKDRHALCDEIFEILAAGLMKRLLHTGMKNVVLGVSGGLDSTLALLVCLKAFEKLGYDPAGVIGISMRGLGTSERTENNSRILSSLYGITYLEVDITEAVRGHFADIGHDGKTEDVVFENAQARERTKIIMDVANKYHGLAIGTGDLSEIALGWNTFNGDHMSMYAVIPGVPKSLVRYLIAFAAGQSGNDRPGVLEDIIATPISPELTSNEGGQLTEEILGRYDIHDFILFHFLRYSFGPAKIFFLLKSAFGKEESEERLKWHLSVFFGRFFRNQFKRNAMPDGIKLGTIALSQRADWRMPSDADHEVWLKEINNL